mmetsp:Transcript_19328/g.47432  ORF Transcript_19328/g.47432 Transcript_19328/m.47432 type:complete len:275 (+) Transcript_19328:100-924(+)
MGWVYGVLQIAALTAVTRAAPEAWEAFLEAEHTSLTPIPDVLWFFAMVVWASQLAWVAFCFKKPGPPPELQEQMLYAFLVQFALELFAARRMWGACTILALVNLFGFVEKAYLGAGVTPGVTYVRPTWSRLPHLPPGEIDPWVSPWGRGAFFPGLSVYKALLVVVANVALVLTVPPYVPLALPWVVFVIGASSCVGSVIAAGKRRDAMFPFVLAFVMFISAAANQRRDDWKGQLVVSLHVAAAGMVLVQTARCLRAVQGDADAHLEAVRAKKTE